jgi:hypothetical protein
MQNDVGSTARSPDPRELLASALALARSNRAEDHQQLLNMLWSADFLSRLDSPAEYAQTGRRLRISMVLDALAHNPAPSAANTLVSLTERGPFLDSAERVEFLISACAVIRPAPSQVILFWDAHCQPDDGYEHLTMEAIIENGSEPAMELMERKMSDPRHSDDSKLHWMRAGIVPHRNDLPLLRACERLLTRGLPENLRPALVDVLFDYRPEWYKPAHVYLPPDRRQASPEAKEEMRRLARLAFSAVALTSEQKAAIEKAMSEIGPE